MAYPYNYGYYPYQQTQPQQTQQPLQIQNGGFIQVHNEFEARNYPVAPGNSVTFKDENAPYVYTKTMGFSQLDRPIFEKYRLIKEEEPPQPANFEPTGTQSNLTGEYAPYALKSDLDEIRRLVDDLRNNVENIIKENKE